MNIHTWARASAQAYHTWFSQLQAQDRLYIISIKALDLVWKLHNHHRGVTSSLEAFYIDRKTTNNSSTIDLPYHLEDTKLHRKYHSSWLCVENAMTCEVWLDLLSWRGFANASYDMQYTWIDQPTSYSICNARITLPITPKSCSESNQMAPMRASTVVATVYSPGFCWLAGKIIWSTKPFCWPMVPRLWFDAFLETHFWEVANIRLALTRGGGSITYLELLHLNTWYRQARDGSMHLQSMPVVYFPAARQSNLRQRQPRSWRGLL